ncbi:alpha/beta hydrolase [Listeria booriae]|uniref:alpha/beta hydrolase n=1 Tax=Listeria booriae TaxID=1552123 RepID=UPI0028800E42|nr:alpha/beta hydrolase [Listeria booriae]MDT0112105.1 alpha/beta hydrolase [Listeria booriae]
MFAYDIYEPINRKTNDVFPTVFALHGLGADELDLPGILESVMDRFVIVGIRGGLQKGPGYAFYKPVVDGEPSEESITYAANDIHNFIEKISRQYPTIDRKNMYLLGFEQGGIVAMTEFVRNGGMYHGGIFLSAKLPAFLEKSPKNLLLKNKRIFVGHGVDDAIVPVEEGERITRFFKTMSDNVTMRTYYVQHNVNAAEEDEIIDWLTETEQVDK